MWRAAFTPDRRELVGVRSPHSKVEPLEEVLIILTVHGLSYGSKHDQFHLKFQRQDRAMNFNIGIYKHWKLPKNLRL